MRMGCINIMMIPELMSSCMDKFMAESLNSVLM